MGSASSPEIQAFRATLDLFQSGVDLMRQNLRRRHPEASNEEIERRRVAAGATRGRVWRLPGQASEREHAIDVTALETALRQICAELTETRSSFALVGGLAVSARTEPRFTRDADIAVAVDSDAEAEALIHRLRVAGYEIEAIVEQEAVGRLATARLTARKSRPPLSQFGLEIASAVVSACRNQRERG